MKDGGLQTIFDICHHAHSVNKGGLFCLALLMLLDAPCQSCPCQGLEEMWSLRFPVEGPSDGLPSPPSFQLASPCELNFYSIDAAQTYRNTCTLFSNVAWWKDNGLNHGSRRTNELRLEIPSACSPISASLLASSRLLTPQLGATLVLQRMWTFILHTEE